MANAPFATRPALGGPLFASALVLGLPAFAGAPEPRPDGFWKCRATSDVHGEFGGEDPVGLAGHAHIATNCSIHWSDGDRTYCFSSTPSLLEFQSNLDVLPKARAFWESARGK